MHRVSYEHHIGLIPDGYMICHKCNNPKCINPDHLYAGTRKDNDLDRVKERLRKCLYKEQVGIHAKVDRNTRISVVEKCIKLGITINDYINTIIENDLKN